MTDTRISDKLYAPLTVDSRRGRGGTYGYVKWQAVADRMNETFGMNWSSSVVHEDSTDSMIVVRVSVCAKDPISNDEYCQEGYGASEIRGSDEAGSAHKGAYSKALKDACKKWGIGLHLEEDGSSAPASMPSGFTGYETGQPTPTGPPAPSVPPSYTPVAPAPVAPAPTAAPTMPAPAPAPTGGYVAPTTAPVTPTAEMGLPTIPAPAGVNPMAPTPSAPTQMVPSTPASTPASTPVMAPPAPAPANTGSSPETPGTITSVQDMAIQNLSRLNGVEGQTMAQFLQGLVDNPECELSRSVSTLNELSYNEAVYVIKAAKSL